MVTCITRIFKEIITLIKYHLFCLFLQFCETFKQVARAAFVQFSHIFKRNKLMLRKDPLHCWYCIIDMTKSSLGFLFE